MEQDELIEEQAENIGEEMNPEEADKVSGGGGAYGDNGFDGS
jgi:hypothetical protein